jgi:hypothetical protein
MKSTLKLPNSTNDDNSNKKNETQSQSRPLPIYAVVLIVLGCISLLLSLTYLLYSKNKKKQSSSSGKVKYKGPIREVWSNPELDSALNIINRDKSNDLKFNKNNQDLNSNIDIYKSELIEFNK